MTTWVSLEANSSPVKPTDENGLANTLKLGGNNSNRNEHTVFYMHSYLYQWFFFVLWIWITRGTFLSAKRTSFVACVGMLNNVHRSAGPLSEALTLLTASERITSHVTGDLANKTATWAWISCHIFLEMWKADACLRKTREDPSYLLISG